MRLKRDTKDVIESTILLILGCAEQSAVIFAFLLHVVSVSPCFLESSVRYLYCLSALQVCERICLR